MKEALENLRRVAPESVEKWTEAIDRILISYFETLPPEQKKWALVAQGGYGRRELCYHSDIDLLFLYDGQPSLEFQQAIEKFLRELWDAGFEVGAATRTVHDCRHLMAEDLTILTALLDARFLIGEKGLFLKLEEEMRGHFSQERERKKFWDLKQRESEERWQKYGGSVYLLEPHLKEGKGGLRDFHTLLWLEKGFNQAGILTPSESEKLWQAVHFLLKIRNELHRRAGRRQDQLLFEAQEGIAQSAGFKTDGEILPVELFMQHYYHQAEAIQQITAKALHKFENLFSGSKQSKVQPALLKHWRGRRAKGDFQNPIELLQVFEEARQNGCEIDDRTLDRIEKNLFRIDAPFRLSAESGAFFRKMLGNLSGLGRLLGLMNRRGVLGALLPEFAKLHFRVQHDLYHVYTVDIHSIFAVQELENLYEGKYAAAHPTFSQLAKEVSRIDLLVFGILYHDIGKGEGKGHVEKGAPLIRQAAGRLGFSPADLEALEFLERSHLIMTHLAFRRDLEDPNLIIQFARAVQNEDYLNWLCLLTFCDLKAVSPEAMTGWKASLLEYLYLKTREVFRQGATTPALLSALLPKIREQVEKRIRSEEARQATEEIFTTMPPRYLLATPPELIAEQAKLWGEFSEKPFLFQERLLEREGVHSITLLTWDTPALFSKMCGLYAAHNMNILGAELSVSRRGIALHHFRVTDHRGFLIEEPEKWEKLQQDLRNLLEGKVPVENLVAEKFRPSIFKSRSTPPRPARVEIDNDVSAYYTVIDIYASDRVGLLYQITSTLAALGLYVEVSKVSTKVDQVADTFYVKDIFGHKLLDKVKLNRIREALVQVLSTPPTPEWKPPRGI